MTKQTLNYVLPAYAGMIRRESTMSISSTCAPRVCGDDPPPRLAICSHAAVLPAYAGMIHP